MTIAADLEKRFAEREAQLLDDLFAFLRIPSVSAKTLSSVKPSLTRKNNGRKCDLQEIYWQEE